MYFMRLKEIIKLGAPKLDKVKLEWLNYGVSELLCCMTKECLAFYIQTKMNGEDVIEGLFFLENKNADPGWLVVQEEIRRLGGVEPFLDEYDDSRSTSSSSVCSTTDSSSDEETDDTDDDDEGEGEDEVEVEVEVEDICSHDAQPREEIQKLLQMSVEELPVKKMVDSFHLVILNGRETSDELEKNKELLRRKAVVQSRIMTKGWGAFKEEVSKEEQNKVEVATNGLSKFITEVRVFAGGNRLLPPDNSQRGVKEHEDRIFSFYCNKFGPLEAIRARVPPRISQTESDVSADEQQPPQSLWSF